MGKTNGPVLGVSTFADYQEHKWQYVRKQYGVLDATDGAVKHCTEDVARFAAENEPKRYKLMSRHVSDWIPDE